MSDWDWEDIHVATGEWWLALIGLLLLLVGLGLGYALGQKAERDRQRKYAQENAIPPDDTWNPGGAHRM